MRKLASHQLLPGMPAEVFIKTGEQTPFGYLTQPLRESFQHAWREPVERAWRSKPPGL